MPDEGPDGLVQIGCVVRPHGVRGELVVRPWAAEHENIFRPGPMWLVRGSDERRIEVTEIRWHKGDVLLRAERITDREAAERCRGWGVYVPAGQLPELDANTYYVDDLIGCSVIDPQGAPLGEVEGVLRTGGVDVLKVRAAEGRWMLPAADEFILEVDVGAGRMTVRLVDGLRDLQC